MQYFMSKLKQCARSQLIWVKQVPSLRAEALPSCRPAVRERRQREDAEAQVSRPGPNVHFQRKIPKEIIFHNNCLHHNAAGMGVCFFSTCEPKIAHQALSYSSPPSDRPLHTAKCCNQYVLRVHCHPALKFALIWQRLLLQILLAVSPRSPVFKSQKYWRPCADLWIHGTHFPRLGPQKSLSSISPTMQWF